MLLSIALLASLLAADETPACNSTAACNRLGSEALQKGRMEDAKRLFERQLDYADTDLRQADGETDDGKLRNAREIALNNAALAALRAGDCLYARAWLEAADPAHKATLANRKVLAARCDGRLDAVEKTGEFRQYVGHGAWNAISLRETGDETLQFSAFWMRISRGPVHEWGLAAFGEIDQAFVHVDGDRGRGGYQGLDPNTSCELQIHWIPGGLEISHTDVADCRVGGAGAELFGKYWRVGEATETATDADDSAASPSEGPGTAAPERHLAISAISPRQRMR